MCLPVGPIGVLCIKRTLSDGPRAGFTSGLGAATADAIYCAIAELGISYVIGFINSYHSWLRIGGGILLLFLGINTFISNPGARNLTETKTICIPVAYVSTFFLTLANPVTIISYSLIGANFGMGIVGNGHFDLILIIIGVFLGSVLWWSVLSIGVNLLKKNLTTEGVRNITKMAGLIVISLGILILFGRI